METSLVIYVKAPRNITGNTPELYAHLSFKLRHHNQDLLLQTTTCNNMKITLSIPITTKRVLTILINRSNWQRLGVDFVSNHQELPMFNLRLYKYLNFEDVDHGDETQLKMTKHNLKYESRWRNTTSDVNHGGQTQLKMWITVAKHNLRCGSHWPNTT